VEGLVFIVVIMVLMYFVHSIFNNKDSWRDTYRGSKPDGKPLEDDTFLEYWTGGKSKPIQTNESPIKDDEIDKKKNTSKFEIPEEEWELHWDECWECPYNGIVKKRAPYCDRCLSENRDGYGDEDNYFVADEEELKKEKK